jgi:hypothetical protein
MEDQDYTFEELYLVREVLPKLPAIPGGGTRAVSWLYHHLNLANNPTRRTLRSVAIGRYRYTNNRWLREFLASNSPNIKPALTPGQRDRRRERVKRELAEAGI